jgi:hypothetical protein
MLELPTRILTHFKTIETGQFEGKKRPDMALVLRRNYFTIAMPRISGVDLIGVSVRRCLEKCEALRRGNTSLTGPFRRREHDPDDP